MSNASPKTPRAKWLLALLAIMVTLPLFAAPAAAQEDPYAADPLRLVPFADTVQRVYSSGTDRWEVWICRVSGPGVTIDLNVVVDDLNTIITPYFQWLSRGLYAPVFEAGGEVSSDDVVPAVLNNESFQMPGCESAVESTTEGGAEGALIVVAADFDEGYATGGAFCPEAPFVGCVNSYPQNARRAIVGAAAVTTLAPGTEPSWSSVAHELGHGLNWAHSYGGLTTVPGTTAIDTYDNPMDLMSGGARTRTPVGALAYDRYAAGWIDPTQVKTHTAGSGTYRLAAIGTSGTQMLVLPLEEGNFFVLGTPPAHVIRFATSQSRRRGVRDRSAPDGLPDARSVADHLAVLCHIDPHRPEPRRGGSRSNHARSRHRRKARPRLVLRSGRCGRHRFLHGDGHRPTSRNRIHR